MSDPYPIDSLLSRIALRDRQAFHELYQKTSAKLFGICLRILNDRADAEDVLQEVFVKVWNKADRYNDSRGSAIAWLAMVARNQAIDRLRARRPENVDIEDRLDLADNAPSPEARAVLSAEARRLNACIDELNPQHAETVRMIYLGGLSYQEAADNLGVPMNTAKTWVRRSLLALRDCLKR